MFNSRKRSQISPAHPFLQKAHQKKSYKIRYGQGSSAEKYGKIIFSVLV